MHWAAAGACSGLQSAAGSGTQHKCSLSEASNPATVRRFRDHLTPGFPLVFPDDPETLCLMSRDFGASGLTQGCTAGCWPRVRFRFLDLRRRRIWSPPASYARFCISPGRPAALNTRHGGRRIGVAIQGTGPHQASHDSPRLQPVDAEGSPCGSRIRTALPEGPLS